MPAARSRARCLPSVHTRGNPQRPVAAHQRHVVRPGGEPGARFLAAYEAAAGVRLTQRGMWDAFAAARAIEHGAGWVDAWADVGVTMTVERIRDRAWAFAETALP